MSMQLLSQLRRATLSTFEDLGFVLPAAKIDDEQAAVGLSWSARVAFHGPVDGWLEVRVSNEVASQLAANMLGCEEVIESATKQDALGEIANVICGNLVPALGTPQDVFDLDAPQLSAIEGDETPSRDGTVLLELGIDGGRAELELLLDRGIFGEDAA